MRAPQERLGLLFAGLCALSGAFVPALAKLTTGRADAWFVAAASNLCAAVGAALLVPAIPLLSLAASFLMLGEVASARQWAGMVLTAVGILAFVIAPHPGEPLERILTASALLAVEPPR